MQPLPHHYDVHAIVATPDDPVELSSKGLATLSSAPPAEFGGPGTLWSPETLMMAAIADCFVLTFRAVARAARLEWVRLECGAEGTVDRVDGVTGFTKVRLNVKLTVSSEEAAEKSRKVLEKTEKGCLVSNSLKCEKTLEPEIEVNADRPGDLRVA
jgi:peroxiredoxin-like protein